ncbi:MAG: general secretion pathway protein GspK [Acidobacteria bacterium]|nr:general secretion pathway protein GspK [Acidobacteriota bacterium]
MTSEPRAGSSGAPAVRAPERGGALLAVLWVSAALAAIAFSVAITVRGETERASTAIDGVRAHYVATGAMERALLYVAYGPQAKRGGGRFFTVGTSVLHFSFPSGEADVEVIPEEARLNINSIPPPDLLRLLLNLGVSEDRAREITEAILDWRSPAPGLTDFDHHYLSLTPSFRARHASFEETEELLLVKGMTPEIYHGTYVRDAEGRLRPVGALKNCVSVWGSTGSVDVNTAEPAVLATVGMSPETVGALVARRRATPFHNMQEVQESGFGGPGVNRLRIGGASIFSLRATAWLRLDDGRPSDLRRTVSGTFKISGEGPQSMFETLRWYEN